ncbi:MAG TPA: SRPBCC family protein, partial [Mycobacterium sp.]|nr:SRPBCC family protein [Mycobacterium sp.]
MGHIEAERELPAPVDAVWALIADPSKWADWFT